MLEIICFERLNLWLLVLDFSPETGISSAPDFPPLFPGWRPKITRWWLSHFYFFLINEKILWSLYIFNCLTSISLWIKFPQWLRIWMPMQETQETWIWSLGQEDPLEEEMATHSSVLAWRIPWSEEPGGLQSMGSQRIGHGWACTHTHTDNFSEMMR